MSHKLEFFFDFGSPASYLAYTQLPGLVSRTGAQLVWKPMLLGGVFKETGNASPVAVPAKGAYMFKDLSRCANRFGVPIRFNPHFPINTIFLMRSVFVAEEEGRTADFIDMAFKAVWVDEQNLNDHGVTAQVYKAADFDPDHYLARSGEADIKDLLKGITAEAVERGVFGAPTFFVDGTDMFFGQDRLDFVEDALMAHRMGT